MTTDLHRVTPLVLLVDDQEWMSLSIESILRPKGYAVVKAFTGRQALDLAEKVSPDLIVVDFRLPDMDGIEVARQLREASTVSPATPILMITTSSLGRAERLEALGAGAWDILRHPVDPSEFVLRMETLLGAKQEADRVRDEGLTDPSTGFYNARGLLRRTKEISADATRFDRPLACIAFGLEWLDTPTALANQAEEQALVNTAQSVADALKSITRVSDTVGRLTTGEFIIVAPGTDRAGAERLADRVLELVGESVHRESGPPGFREGEGRLRAGFFATAGDSAIDPGDVLFKATVALRRAQADQSGFPVRSYEA
ncbi:MAG TPA: response regulator [Longimicrobiales bacterium]|nr:response regulator [Longimicrobiales bacterium]